MKIEEMEVEVKCCVCSTVLSQKLVSHNKSGKAVWVTPCPKCLSEVLIKYT